VPSFCENLQLCVVVETRKFTLQKHTVRLLRFTHAKLPPPSSVVSGVSMYTSSLVSRFSVGFVAISGILVNARNCNFQPMGKAFFGDFFERKKVTRLKRNLIEV